MNKERDIDFEIIWQKLNNQVNDVDDIAFQKWLCSHSKNRSYFEKVKTYYEQGQVYDEKSINSEDVWNAIEHKLTKESKNKYLPLIKAVASIAAIFVLVFSIYIMQDSLKDETTIIGTADTIAPGHKKARLIMDDGKQIELVQGQNFEMDVEGATIANNDASLSYNTRIEEEQQRIQYNTLEVGRGEEYDLQLADGTRVWLNSESTLKFPVAFTGDTRLVELTGEACFDVAHNESVPFIVKSNESEVRVLGTLFNISAYSDESYIATTLLEGSVEVSYCSEKVVLEPGIQAYIDRDNVEIQTKKVNARMYTSWINGVFEFQNQSLEQITNQLSRWYDVEFEFADETDRTIRFAGAIDRNKALGFGLGLIEKVSPVSFEINEHTIIVSSVETKKNNQE